MTAANLTPRVRGERRSQRPVAASPGPCHAFSQPIFAGSPVPRAGIVTSRSKLVAILSESFSLRRPGEEEAGARELAIDMLLDPLASETNPSRPRPGSSFQYLTPDSHSSFSNWPLDAIAVSHFPVGIDQMVRNVGVEDCTRHDRSAGTPLAASVLAPGLFLCEKRNVRLTRRTRQPGEAGLHNAGMLVGWLVSHAFSPP